MSESKELKECLQLRSNIKARTTLFQKYIDIIKLVEPNTLDKIQLNELQLKFSKFQDLFSQFDEVQNRIEALSSDNIAPQLEERELIENTFFKLISVAQNIIDLTSKVEEPDCQSCQGSEANSMKNNMNIKLPTIKLPSFNGDNLKWLEFRDTYESLIHNNSSITPINKFHYLRSSLEGNAAIVIKSINFTASNYNLAWDILCDRYNNKTILINNHIKCLFNFDTILKESHKSLRYMVDYYSKNLRSLEELKEPVQYWDTLIIFIMTSKLDATTSRNWEEYKNSLDLSPTLAEFYEFLRNRANVLETLQHSKADTVKSEKHNSSKDNIKSTKSFVTSSEVIYKKNCVLCNDHHPLFQCEQFKGMTVDDRTNTILKSKLCKNCLRPGHHHSRCRLGPCKICNKKHNTLLHRTHEIQNNNLPLQSASNTSSLSPVSLSASISGHVLLCTAEVEIINLKNNKSYLAKALLDSGSQSSFITENVKTILNVSGRKLNIPILGINNSITNTLETCNLCVKSRNNSFKINTSFLVLKQITDQLPSTTINISSLNLPSHLQLADTTFFKPSQIDILLGGDVFWDIVSSNQIKLGNNKPTLQESKFGWLVAGPTGISPNSSQIHCNFSKEIQNSLVKFWQVEELQSNEKSLSKEEEFCETHFLNTTKRLPSGRFSVKIPFRESPENVLGDSYSISKKLFYNQERRLSKNGQKHNYLEFIHEYEKLGHLSKVKQPNFGYYIPHHAVIRETSETTRLRVVFNASLQTSTGKSLNDIMMIGPVIQDDLLSILIRFRYHKYVVTGDITKMYRQIEIDESQRHLQLIFWRDNECDPLQILQLNTVTYGTAAAPFLSTRCLIQLGNECDDKKVANVIKHDFYVDDLITGSSSKPEVKHLLEGVVQKLNEGCFSLHKFRTNVPEIFANLSIVNQTQDFCKESSILGLKWLPDNDMLQFPTHLAIDTNNVTKRNILSASCKIFDPLGLLSACTIIPKILLQSLWLLKLDWDDPIPQELKYKWLEFSNNLYNFTNFEIPRHVLCDTPDNVEIHCFTDASQSAYGACLYLKSFNRADHTIHINLLCAKARVAPIKPEMTIPRLELLGALLGARLYSKVLSSLRIQGIKSTFWCDSTIILAWIKSQPKTLKTFVCNRIEKIRKLTDENSWRYVPTGLNPADLASRGIPPQQLKTSSLWWHGPRFLFEPESNWPVHPTCSTATLPETKISLLVQNKEKEENIIPFTRYSKLYKLQRVIAYVNRFIHNCKYKNNRLTGSLQYSELNKSLLTLARQSQRDSFHDEILTLSTNASLHKKSKLISLNPFLDSIGILRVGGRIENASHCNYDKRHPIVINSEHLFSRLLFEREHLRLLHCGPQQLLSSVRDQFWPVGGRKLATKTVHKCIICTRFKAQSIQPLMGNLPTPRVTPAFPFETCGTDFAGPFYILNRKGRGARTIKCYLCLFVCFSTKALHLEVVSDLSTNSFLLCLRRFISRRGKPNTIYCDNGKTFVGADRELNRLLIKAKRDVDDFACREGINFKFSPAYSPNFGGIWEAGVKAAKFHLKRIVGNTNLTFEEITTIFAQIEAILNSRPLTPLSSDPADLSPLTPGHFLIGRPLTAMPMPVAGRLSSTRYKLLENLRQHFWRRWTKEFLSDLQQRVKWRTTSQNLKLGDLVVIKDEQLPPMKWLLGRIHKLHLGTDGIARVVDIYTNKGVIRRAVSKVCCLEDREPTLQSTVLQDNQQQ